VSQTAIDRLNAALSGRYRVEGEIGQGGMAIVYLADDLRHDRKVALKVLKPELAAVLGAERFLAEIKTTANLQHPHILPLYDSGEADGFLYYVMPYIEGETLRDRLERESQLPVDEAVRIAVGVANALETAHDQGVVHRDIKPANILLSRGEPLVADFGIALAVGAAGGSRLTETGLSVGTPYYMSPEQATGQHVGPASDIYALGAVLYEMLTGDPPYMGKTAQAVLGQILVGEAVSTKKKRPSVPANVDAAIAKALERLPADRFTSAHELGRALADPGFRHREDAAPAMVSSGVWRPLAVVMSAATLALLVNTFVGPSSSSVDPVVRLNVQLPDDEGLAFGAQNRLAISPDGTKLVYVGVGAGGRPQLWMRDLSQLSASPLARTQGACCPTFSPDGASIAYVERADQLLKTMSVGGGSAITVASGVLTDRPSWGEDGYIYVASDPSRRVSRAGLFRVPETGGDLEPVTSLDPTANEALHQTPMTLPSGTGLLFAVSDGIAATTIAVMDFGTGEHRELTTGIAPLYTATGHLLYLSQQGALYAAPFDERRLEITGPAVVLAEGVATGVSYSMYADIAISETGTLVYTAGSGGRESVVWVDREGDWEPVEEGWIENFETVELSPTGDRLAVSIAEGASDHQLWTRVLPSGSLTKLTIEGALNFRPSWSADGERLLFVSDRGETPNDLYARPVSGGVAELVLDLERSIWEGEWSPDGEWLIYRTGIPPTRDLFVKNVHPDSAGRTISASDAFEEIMPTLSPDGRWLAYQSNETGLYEIYVRPFPNIDDDKRPVSTDGGIEPLWSRDGSELFYKNAAGELESALVATQPGFAVLERRVLFSVVAYQRGDEFCCHPTYDVHPDGERFVMIRRVGDDGGLVLVQNFFRELRERVPN
jgi:serine/threonine protein kinase